MSSRIRHRRETRKAETELNITPFLDLMVALVSFLLMTIVFERVSIMDLQLPELSAATAAKIDKKLELEIVIRERQLVIEDNNGGVIETLPFLDNKPDVEKLSLLLQQIKARLPDKKNISILSEPNVPYQHIVSTMDTARSYPTVVAASLVNAELFPEIALGDAPTGGAQ